MFKNILGGKEKNVNIDGGNDVPSEQVKETDTQVADSAKSVGVTAVEVNNKKTDNMPTILFPRIRGNDYCPCGSNKKFNKCCSKDTGKIRVFSEVMDIRLTNKRLLSDIKMEGNRQERKEKK